MSTISINESGWHEDENGEGSDFSWFRQHTPDECAFAMNAIVEGVRSEMLRIAQNGHDRVAAKYLTGNHVNFYIDVQLDDEIEMQPELEYEINLKGRNWRRKSRTSPDNHLRIHRTDSLSIQQIEAILQKATKEQRAILADMLIYDCITAVCTLAEGDNVQKMDSFELLTELDESLPAQFYQLHTNIRAGTLSK